MADGDIKIDISLDDSKVAAEASRVGTQAGKGISSGVEQGTEKSGGLLDKLKGKFSTVFAAIGGITAGFSLANMAQQIVEVGKQFETSMSNVAALSGATGDELGQLEDKARELGASTTFSASQAADALGYMALAGWDTAEMLDGVDDVLTLAQAGMMDLGQASDLVTDYLSAFGMGADETTRMVDVLSYAQANANTTVEGLGMAFKNAAANAHAAGLDVETTTAAISMMANQGLKGAEAGTALNAVMRDMTAQMEDGAIEIGDTSVAVMDAQGNYRDFADIIADVESATYGMGDAERAAALQGTFTADSINGINLMLNAGADELVSFRDELYSSAGAGEKLADVMTDNLQGDVAEMNSALEELQIKIYQGMQEPLRKGTQFITNAVVPALTALVQNFDKIAPVLATLGVALLAYRKNWDIVTAAQKLAAKAAADSSTTFTKYFRTVSDGQETIYKWNNATQSYEKVQKTMKTTLATTTAGIKAQEVAQKASTVAMELGSKAANVLGKALKTMAPVAILSAVIGIADAFRQSAEEAKDLETATEGLTGAYDNFSDAMNATEKAVESHQGRMSDLIDENKKVISAQKELADSIADTWSDVGSDSGLVKKYTDTIEELTRKYDENGNAIKLTADQQADLKVAVEGLNEITGQNYEILDLVNGELSVSTSEIKKNSDAWIDNAKAQAAQEALTGIYKQQLDVERQMEETTKKLSEANSDYNVTVMDGIPILSGNAGEIMELEKQQESLQAEYDSLGEAADFYTGIIGDNTAKQAEQAEAAEQASEANAENADAMAEGSEAAQKLSEDVVNIIEDINELLGTSSVFSKAFSDSGWTVVELAERLDIAGVSAGDLASAMEENADRTANAFDKIEQKSDITLESMLGNLQHNVQATQSWRDNVAALYDKAGSDVEVRFIGYLESMGPEYAGILQQLNDDTTGKLQEMAKAWGEGMDLSADIAVEKTGVMSDEVTQQLEELNNNANAEGQEFPGQLAVGMESMQGTAVDAADTVADATMGAYDNAVNSSRQTIVDSFGNVVKAGTNEADTVGKSGMESAASNASGTYTGTIDGHEVDFRNSGQGAASSAAGGADSLNGNNGAWFNSGTGAGQSYTGGVSSTRQQALGVARGIGADAANEMNQEGQAKSSGEFLGQGFIRGMSSTMSQVISNARSLADAAINTIKKRGGEGSPWKTTKASGRFAAEGLAVGMMERINQVKQRAADLAGGVLSGIDVKAGSDGVAWDATKKRGRAAARGIIVGFELENPMAQLESSIANGISAVSVAAMAGSMSSTTNNQTLNFNQPVQSPDVIARNLRMQQRYGLAGGM